MAKSKSNITPPPKSSINPQPVQLKFLQATESIVFFGGGAGGGKTWSILIDNLQFCHDPQYFSVFVRTTNVEIDNGLWPEAKRMYMPYLVNAQGKFIGKAHISEKNKTITFPSGGRSKFTYCSTDRDVDAWYGSEITRIYLDEVQQRSEYQFDLFKSRNRSMANVPKGMRCTLNPDPSSFIYKYVEPFLDEDKFPIPELSGKTRYYTIVNGVLFSSWDKEGLIKQTGKQPETYTYIPATLEDNEELKKRDPSYINKLDALPEAKRKQLLLGSWASTEEDGLYFRREYLKKTTHVPLGSITIRSYDLASSAGDTPNTAGCDATQGTLMSKTPDGRFIIHGSTRYRKKVGDRDAELVRQGKQDGTDVIIVIPKDSGAGGAAAYEYLSKRLISEGFRVKCDPTPATQSKLKKAEPFFSACENGLVSIIESAFDPEELQLFYRELEIFDGVTRSTRTRHDETVDSCASGFNILNKTQVIPKITMPSLMKANEFKF